MSTPARSAPLDLRDSRRDVGGQRVGHGLHGDRRVAADRHPADKNLPRFPAFDVLVGAIAHALCSGPGAPTGNGPGLPTTAKIG